MRVHRDTIRNIMAARIIRNEVGWEAIKPESWEASKRSGGQEVGKPVGHEALKVLSLQAS